MQGKTLVAYFSAEGTTAAVAQKIASACGADLFAIRPAVPYTAADLDWMNKKSRSSAEMADPSCRPPLADGIDVVPYDNIFIGFPIWWYVEPRIVDTFLESRSFAGKALFPFATSGGSGIGRACERMKEICPDADWREGKLLNRGGIAEWLRQLS